MEKKIKNQYTIAVLKKILNINFNKIAQKYSNINKKDKYEIEKNRN